MAGHLESGWEVERRLLTTALGGGKREDSLRLRTWFCFFSHPFHLNHSSSTYLTTSPFSNATFPRRTNTVTSVRLPTPRLARSRSRRNISTFCFGCFVTGPFFFSSLPFFSLA